MNELMPSGHAAPSMTSLDRVMLLAYDSGYRVGLQVGEHGYSIVHVRDLTEQRRVIVIIGRTIAEASDALLMRMLAEDYVPRIVVGE